MRWDWLGYTRCFFTLGLPLKVHSTNKLILARLGVSRTIYVNIDSPNLGFPYFNFLGEAQFKITPCITDCTYYRKAVLITADCVTKEN